MRLRDRVSQRLYVHSFTYPVTPAVCLVRFYVSLRPPLCMSANASLCELRVGQKRSTDRSQAAEDSAAKSIILF